MTTVRETYGYDGVLSRVFDDDADGFFERAENVMPDGGLRRVTVTRIDGGTEETEFTDSTIRRVRWLNGAAFIDIERDGGVVRRQVLDDDGWNDVQ